MPSIKEAVLEKARAIKVADSEARAVWEKTVDTLVKELGEVECEYSGEDRVVLTKGHGTWGAALVWRGPHRTFDRIELSVPGDGTHKVYSYASDTPFGIQENPRRDHEWSFPEDAGKFMEWVAERIAMARAQTEVWKEMRAARR